MKRLTLVIGLMLTIGCAKNGKDGANGTAGPQGLPGLSNTMTYSGAITSNTQTVSIPGLDVSEGDLLTVYLCNGVCTQLNTVALPATNLGYYEAPGQIGIYNGLVSGYTKFYATVVTRH